jgi:hypothetical protein
MSLLYLKYGFVNRAYCRWRSRRASEITVTVYKKSCTVIDPSKGPSGVVLGKSVKTLLGNSWEKFVGIRVTPGGLVVGIFNWVRRVGLRVLLSPSPLLYMMMGVLLALVYISGLIPLRD